MQRFFPKKAETKVSVWTIVDCMRTRTPHMTLTEEYLGHQFCVDAPSETRLQFQGLLHSTKRKFRENS